MGALSETCRAFCLTQKVKRPVQLVRSHSEDDEVPPRLPKVVGTTQDGELNGGGGGREWSYPADGDLALSKHGVAQAGHLRGTRRDAHHGAGRRDVAHLGVRVVEEVAVKDELITELRIIRVTVEDLLGYHSS